MVLAVHFQSSQPWHCLWYIIPSPSSQVEVSISFNHSPCLLGLYLLKMATASSRPQLAPSAPSYATSPSPGPSGRLQPGTKVQVGKYVVRVDKFLSEGKYADMYLKGWSSFKRDPSSRISNSNTDRWVHLNRSRVTSISYLWEVTCTQGTLHLMIRYSCFHLYNRGFCPCVRCQSGITLQCRRFCAHSKHICLETYGCTRQSWSGGSSKRGWRHETTSATQTYRLFYWSLCIFTCWYIWIWDLHLDGILSRWLKFLSLLQQYITSVPHHGIPFFTSLGGGIIDLLNSRLQNRLTESEILKIFSDTVDAVAHMHSQKPILMHRDLKVRPWSISYHASLSEGALFVVDGFASGGKYLGCSPKSVQTLWLWIDYYTFTNTTSKYGWNPGARGRP